MFALEIFCFLIINHNIVSVENNIYMHRVKQGCHQQKNKVFWAPTLAYIHINQIHDIHVKEPKGQFVNIK